MHHVESEGECTWLKLTFDHKSELLKGERERFSKQICILASCWEVLDKEVLLENFPFEKEDNLTTCASFWHEELGCHHEMRLGSRYIQQPDVDYLLSGSAP